MTKSNSRLPDTNAPAGVEPEYPNASGFVEAILGLYGRPRAEQSPIITCWHEDVTKLDPVRLWCALRGAKEPAPGSHVVTIRIYDSVEKAVHSWVRSNPEIRERANQWLERQGLEPAPEPMPMYEDNDGDPDGLGETRPARPSVMPVVR